MISATWPIFITGDIYLTEGICCIGGYHSSNGSQPGGQTYAYSTYVDSPGAFSQDVGALSHEIGEWMDDPIGSNPTPLWGHTGQVSGCQSNLEVGDPLSGTEFPALLAANGFTYHMQELAFFSWFYRQSPTLGVNNWFSDNGTFTSDAGAVCH